ncbi:MAG TPA: SUMF1/EgtB/PvdO family nonheme iron enzyme, partial [Azospirillaceae bacterium]|nr:SUMF1/EgtB/PvdO family nonheme iron enzyme [Azospirillaceae bacterium]
YDEAAAYAAWVGGALPTEAQWECAARGGGEYALYPWGDDPPTPLQANIDDPSGGLSPVGSCPTGASGYGVEDMCGNVREWCRDVYDPEFYAGLRQGDVDPCNQRPGPLRALRGGSFESLVSMGRCAYRDGLAQGERRRDVGFRVAYSLNDGEEK